MHHVYLAILLAVQRGVYTYLNEGDRDTHTKKHPAIVLDGGVELNVTALTVVILGGVAGQNVAWAASVRKLIVLRSIWPIGPFLISATFKLQT